jgi:hypothetical protein
MFNSNLVQIHLFIKSACHHVGTVIVGGFPPKKEVVAVDPNFLFGQGKSRFMSILSYPSNPL